VAFVFWLSVPRPLSFTLDGCFLAFTYHSLEIFDRLFLAEFCLSLTGKGLKVMAQFEQ
jgi:hypothetical protein